MQEIDKLKLILFNRKQRKIFDNIPKIRIEIDSKKEKNRVSLVSDNLIKKKNKRLIKKTQNYEFLFNGDTINQRLFALTDNKIKEQLQQYSNYFVSFEYFLMLFSDAKTIIANNRKNFNDNSN